MIGLRLSEEDAALAPLGWRKHSEGYAVRTVRENGRQRTVYLHREILGLRPGDGLQADHINGDRLDNRRENLRVVVNAQNAQNRRAVSGYRGVYFDKSRGKWMARVKINYRHHFVGRFDDELEAAVAAEEYRRKHYSHAVPWDSRPSRRAA